MNIAARTFAPSASIASNGPMSMVSIDSKSILATIPKVKMAIAMVPENDAEREDQRAHECDDQSRQCPDKAKQESDEPDDGNALVDVARRENRNRQRYHAADDRTENRHFDGIDQRRNDLREERPVRLKNFLQKVHHLAEFCDDDVQIKACHAKRQPDCNGQEKDDYRRAASAPLDRMSIGKRYGLGFEDAVVECKLHQRRRVVFHGLALCSGSLRQLALAFAHGGRLCAVVDLVDLFLGNGAGRAVKNDFARADADDAVTVFERGGPRGGCSAESKFYIPC